MSDTLILRNAALPLESTAADFPAQGWVALEPGIYWRGESGAYAAPATVDIVGVADASAVKAQFLLLP